MRRVDLGCSPLIGQYDGDTRNDHAGSLFAEQLAGVERVDAVDPPRPDSVTGKIGQRIAVRSGRGSARRKPEADAVECQDEAQTLGQ